ncbi:MAG: hypothetical protein ACFFB0_06345 [Promethearchaeota archaeon]
MAIRQNKLSRSKKHSQKKLLILSFLFTSLFLISFLRNIDMNFTQNISDQNNVNDFEFTNLATQNLDDDNSYSGIGAPWNVTHYANYTKSNLAVSFTNNSYDDTHAKVELYDEWMGYQMNSTITNLYDTRNWINGTFHAGNFGGSPSGTNDSEYIANWTFYDGDIGPHNNPTSGNYFDGSTSTSGFEDCLELRVEDDSGSYDVGDKCWWETNIQIDRGDVDEAWLSFAAFPKYSDGYNNHWVLQIIINDKIIWGNGLQSMIDASGNSNGQWYNPYPIYIDSQDTQIFPAGVKNLNVTFEFKRVSGTAPSAYYAYYTVLFDNVSLIVKSKAKPSQLELQLNDKDVKDNANYGEGNLGVLGNWNGSLQSSVIANFSSNANWPLTYDNDGNIISYKIELDANLNLFTTRLTPETYYTADPSLIYQGSSFISSNNSNSNWTTYAHMEIPAGYEETNITIEYPLDYNLTKLSFSQFTVPFSQTSIRTYGNKKVINIPASSITSNTNMFWKLEAESPNYCSELDIYNGPTITGPWELNNTFLSGEYINITGKIVSPQLDISGYVGQTMAHLYIRFPDGTIWAAENQIKQVNGDGMVYFDPFMIPDTDIPSYKAGEYQAIILWNNSYSSNDLNETGIIYKKFTVIHDSTLEPDQGIDFIENVFDDRVINIKVSYNDLINNKAIENATVYTDYTGSPEPLSEIGPGYYLYEFNASKASAGNNTITIYAEHDYYLNKEVNITVEVVKETVLTVEKDFFTRSWNDNFTVKFNYTEKNTGFGIDAKDNISIDWLGDYHLIQPVIGQYELECNTSAYNSLTLQSLLISIDKYQYEAQSVLIRVQITELETYLKLFVNQNPTNYSDSVHVELGETINITVQYRDNLTNNHLAGATVNLTGLGLTLNDTGYQYTKIIGADVLDQGITAVTVFAQKENYKPQSINFFIEVGEKATVLQLFLNGEDKTSNPVFNLTITEKLNITVKYTELTGTYIPNAIVELIGEGISTNLTRDDALKQYYIELDTIGLGIRVNSFSIIARATNYKIQTINPYITINRISTLINISSQITAKPGDDVSLKVTLIDTYFGGAIKDVIVTYRWAYGQGELNDTNNDGTYEGFLENVPEGTYTITITAFGGDEYDFESKEITLIVSRPTVSAGPDLSWLIYVLVGGIIGLVMFFTLYQTHFKYPPKVRKIRKLRKKIRKEKKIKPISIGKREEIIKSTIQDQKAIIEFEPKLSENKISEYKES